jgi:hypothetical protein
MARPRGVDLSGSKVVAAVLATLTAAVAASYLGVAGTLIGAAVASVVSTVGNELYQHYLLRSQERLKAAGSLIQQRAAARARTGERTAERTRDLARQAARRDGRPDPEQTQTLPGLGADWRAHQVAARAGLTAAQRAAGDAGAAPGNGQVAGPGHWWQGLTRRQWAMAGALAAGIFIVVIAGITVFEMAVGKPLNAAVYGQHATGTTVSNVLGGHSSGTATPQPTGHHAPQPGTSGSAGSSSAPSSPAATPSSLSPSPVTSTPASAAPSSAVPTTGSSLAPTTGTQGGGAKSGGAPQSGAATPVP